MIIVVLGEKMRFAPTTTAASHSPEERAWQASDKAVKDEEQAVRTVKLCLSATEAMSKERGRTGSPWSRKAELAADAICRHVIAISGQLIHMVTLSILSVDLLPVSLEEPYIDTDHATI